MPIQGMKFHHWFLGLVFFWGGGLCEGRSLSFSGPILRATLAWTDPSRPGVPATGADWFLVDPAAGFLLVNGMDFNFFDKQGRWQKVLQPLDPKGNFYGFCGVQFLSGHPCFLVRLESAQEQWGKDNFEMRSKPGVRRIILDAKGQVLERTEWADPDQPHSSYWLLDDRLYAIHDDGTYRARSEFPLKPGAEEAVKVFALVSSSPEHWMAHLRSLPVFHSKDRAYHDIQGNTHPIKAADSFLMGKTYVEGVGPLGLRRDAIYYQVLCDTKAGFRNAVFVEDPAHKRFGWVELVPTKEDWEGSKKPALFLDPHGDVFEGVASPEGYRIYEWKRLN